MLHGKHDALIIYFGQYLSAINHIHSQREESKYVPQINPRRL